MLIVNSFASSVTARNTVVVHRRLARGHDVEVVETNRRGHATRFAHDAARRGVDVVIGYGGDGTLNEVATGIAGTDAALGVLPGGSTNVFARTLGMPNDPIAAAELLARGIDAADLRPIGLGRVNGRFFCFHTGIGYDAAVVQAVERRASLKRWLGHPLFISAALTTWLHGYDRRHPHFSLDAGQLGRVDDGYFSIVLNTNPYTYLGNRALDLSPAATLDRGLVVVTFRTLRVLPILRGLGLGAARRRRHIERGPGGMARRRPHDGRVLGTVPLPGRRGSSRLGQPARIPPRTRRRAARVSGRRRLRLLDGRGHPSSSLRTAVATSGRFVQMPSTPHAINRRIRSGSSHVHVLSARPLAWARCTSSGVDGFDIRVDRHVASRRRYRESVIVGGHDQPCGANSRRNRSDEIDGFESEGRHEPPGVGIAATEFDHRTMCHPFGRIEIGVGRIVLDLDVDERTLTGVERLRQRRHVIRQLARRDTVNQSSVCEGRVVVHDQGIVGGASYVELDAVGAHLHGTSKRGEGVLAFRTRCTSVSNDQCHVTIVADRRREPSHSRPITRSRYLIFRWALRFYLIFLPTVRTTSNVAVASVNPNFAICSSARTASRSHVPVLVGPGRHISLRGVSFRVEPRLHPRPRRRRRHMA